MRAFPSGALFLIMFHLNVFKQFAQDLKQNMTLISNKKFN